MRKLLISVGIAAIAIALWHGVYIPVAWLQPVTSPLLADRAVSFKADKAVVSLLPTPKLRLLNAELDSTLTGQPLARAGLLTLGLRVKPGQARWLELHALTVKEAEIWVDQSGAEGSNWSAWPRVPPRSDKKLRLPQQIIFENSFIYFQNANIGSVSVKLDRLHLLRDGSAQSVLAARFQHPDFSGNLQATGFLQADDDSWRMENIQSESTGRIAGYPWTLTTAIQSVENDAGVPLSPLKLTHLRFYAKRDDDPDEHQAVFSAAATEMYPSDGRTRFRFAEWTYTHEKAEAWTFHAELDAALGRLTIRPATIPGSEAIPARPLALGTRCAHSQAVWLWNDGWFFWKEELRRNANARTLTCKID